MWKILNFLFLFYGLMGSGTAIADDIDILNAVNPQVDPNVLIIFDTSGSMAIEDVPAEPYRRETDYGIGSGYENGAVYRWQHLLEGGGWVKLLDWDVLDNSCLNAGLIDELGANGQAWARVNTASPHDCNGAYDEIDLRMGNYLNYENVSHAFPMMSRLDAAKEVVKQLIADHPNVRFGLMRFSEGNGGAENDTEGGRISEHGDINDNPTVEQLHNDIDAFSAETFTPLAETLAEAGLYFAGQNSWFHNLTYTSPIDMKCRPNFIILMTDGHSTRDQDSRLHQDGAYLHNGTIGDYDDDGNEDIGGAQGGSDYLDDVAAFLYENDLMPNMGTGDSLYAKQNIVTHTIGFKHAHRLLRQTAKNGGGRYFTTGSTSGLARAFDKLFASVENSRHVYVAPTIPVSSLNGVYAGDFLYLTMFKPNADRGRWRGNLKKYHLDLQGRLLDRNGQAATDSNGIFLNTAQSFWSETVDGDTVDLGGAGAMLVNHPARNLYTYVGGDNKDLSAPLNAFSISNRDNIPLSEMGVASDEERRGVISDIHGNGKEWVMGDVIHSEPTIVRYDTNKNNQMDEDDDALVFVGTNGGVLHAFWDSSGEENWGFIPPHQLSRLKALVDRPDEHQYFLDGPPVAVEHEIGGAIKKILIFGERRGGRTYSVLDVTDPDNPLWNYAIGHRILGEGAEPLGQSWGRPQIVSIANGPASSRKVFLLPGGYDTNQDARVPAHRDTMGRAVFSVELESGRLGGFKFYSDGDGSDMTHCIVDLIGIDPDGDGVTDSIYAPDLGGNIFAFNDMKGDGTWRKLRLFNASSDGVHRKIFHSPDVVRIVGDPVPGDDVAELKIGEMVYFGTGDRAHPEENKVKNRFYAIKNYWWDADRFDTITDHVDTNGDGDLHDATQNLIVQGTSDERDAAETEIENRLGWFIELAAEGEKVVSSPVVYNQTVYFTTYAPPPENKVETEDECHRHGDATGIARLYGVDYKDARAVHDNWSSMREYRPESGEEIKTGGKADRSLVIGRSMPSAPLIAIRDGVAMLYVGVEGDLLSFAPKQAVEMNMYYWRELKP